MQITANDIHERTGISIGSLRKKQKDLFPDQPFDKYAVLNGKTEAIVLAYLESNRTPAKAKRELKKILSDGEQVSINANGAQTTHLEPSKAAGVAANHKQPIVVKSAGKDWRNILAVLPLPMLGLSASYGVYYFASHFAPSWVACIEAMAFELTYIGLAMQSGLDEQQRVRANRISVFAMLVSVLYNVAAGFIHQVPGFVDQIGTVGKLALSVLHGLPIPALAWAVADLLLHRKS